MNKNVGVLRRTNPSGRIFIICFPMMRELLCKMLLGRTEFSEIDISLSKSVFVRKSNHPSMGSYIAVSRLTHNTHND
jgi:hypothetical protein